MNAEDPVSFHKTREGAEKERQEIIEEFGMDLNDIWIIQEELLKD